MQTTPSSPSDTAAASAASFAPDRLAEIVVALARDALAAPDVPSAIRPLLETLVRRTSGEGSVYFHVEGAIYRARATYGAVPNGPVMATVLAHGLPGDNSLMRALTTASAPLFFGDTNESPTVAGFRALGVASLAAAPVHDRRGHLLGAFVVHTLTPHTWTNDEARLVAATTGAIAPLIASRVAEEEAVASHEGALRALGLALDERDRETKGHTDRVTTLALRLGQALGLDDEALTALRWGSYLHDIGKIMIPDSVLRKPEQLDETEWRLIRTHPVLGEEFCAQLPGLPHGSLAVIRHHHEQWDGNGYPDGLAGEAIPLLARIFAICDVYDALTSDRWYDHAWTHGGALAELSSQAGHKFDPAIVAVFMDLAPVPFPGAPPGTGRHLA